MSDEPKSSSPLIEFLRENGAPCPMCRYHLRGVQSDRCPECGYELQLAIARPAAGFGWWLAGLVGLVCTAYLLWQFLKPSIGKVAGVVADPNIPLMVQRGFVASSELPNWSAVFPLSAAMVGCLGLMAMIIGARRRLTEWPLGRQIACGATLLMLPMIVLVLVAVLT